MISERNKGAVRPAGAVLASVWAGVAALLTIGMSWAQEPALEVVAPTLGRPAFVAPGSAFQAIVSYPATLSDASYFIVSDAPPAVRVALPATASGPVAAGPAVAALQLSVPAEIPARTYDFEVVHGARSVRVRHCVSVGPVREQLRIVHLSDLNIGDLTAPHFDERLVDEVNLIGADVLVLTGDVIDATHADPARGWREAVDWLARFDAPAIIARGEHDDESCYRAHIGPSEVGEVRVWWLRALVLSDTPARPLSRAAEQIAWIERALAQPGDSRLTMVVSNSEHPGLLDHWRARGELGAAVSKARIGLWLSGGHTDWDGSEHGELVAAARPLLYVRTHQGSPAIVAGASGASHYRVIDVSPTRADFPGAPGGTGTLPASVRCGGVECWMSGGGGREARAMLHAVSRLPVRMMGLRRRVLLDRRDGQLPWCRGGRLAQVHAHDRFWECVVEFDVPALGAAGVLVGCDAAPPELRLEVEFDVTDVLDFKRERTATGIAYAVLSSGHARLHVRNAGDSAIEATPMLRLAGQRLSYRVAGSSEGPAGGVRLGLPAGAHATLEVELSAIQASAGVHELQVYVSAGGWLASYGRTVEVRMPGSPSD